MATVDWSGDVDGGQREAAGWGIDERNSTQIEWGHIVSVNVVTTLWGGRNNFWARFPSSAGCCGMRGLGLGLN